MDIDDNLSAATALPSLATSSAGLPSVPLDVARYRFAFENVSTNTLPGYSGSTWRGVFGHALKRATCLTKNTSCSHCILRNNCAYPNIFEPSPPADSDRMRRYANIQTPYIIEPEEKYGSDIHGAPSTYTLGISLFGNANRYLPNITHAMTLLKNTTIGQNRQGATLIKAAQERQRGTNCWHTIFHKGQIFEPLRITPPTIPSLQAKHVINLDFLTPMRLRKNNQYIGPDNFCFSVLFNNLLRRISSLLYFYQQQSLDENFRQLSETAQGVQLLYKRLSWSDWTRYSSRQKRKIKMGGLIGSIKLSTEELAPYWPYLWLGQWTHAGKGTSMGLGKYRISFENSRTGERS